MKRTLCILLLALVLLPLVSAVTTIESVSEDDLEFDDPSEENPDNACTAGRQILMWVLFGLAILTFIIGRSFGFLFLMGVFLTWGISILNTCLG